MRLAIMRDKSALYASYVDARDVVAAMPKMLRHDVISEY